MIFDFFRSHRRKDKGVIHLDYASTTPVRTEVLQAMLPYFSDEWANPSAIYGSGVRAKNALEDARTAIARTLHIRSHDVIFTSGGTESNNLALFGLVESLHEAGRAYKEMEIVSTKMEHPSVLESLEVLKRRGVRIVYLHVREDGLIDMNDLQRALSKHTLLITCAYVNSEVGVVQDVKKISRMVRAWNESEKTHVLIHLDASQAPLWLPCELDMLGVDLITLDSGKCYGPKGVGVLAMRHGVALMPQMHGGGQEQHLRSGTENTPGIVGCARSIVLAAASRESRSERIAALRDLMLQELTHAIPGVVVNGSIERRVANNVNISIPGIDTEFAVIALDRAGINASTRSACGSVGNTGS